jgi:hypothetical protein
MATLSKKRKVTEEISVSQEKWALEYFVELNLKALCLICKEMVTVMKDNFKRHYTKHTTKYNDLEGHFQSDKLQFTNQLSGQQSLLLKETTQAENSVKVSYLIVEKNAKCRMSFVDGEFVKECLQGTVDIICPAQKQAVSNISLSKTQ